MDIQCVHELFRGRVARAPDAVAVACGPERLTYRELDRRANQVAHFLRGLGVGPEVLVGICMDCCPESLVGILGVLKAGGAYVPLDPALPPERLAWMVGDCRPCVLLTKRASEGRISGLPSHVAALDAAWPAIACESPEDPEGRVSPDGLAYMIYTSGSTGRPKGIMIPHRGLANYLTWCVKAYAVRAGAGAPVHSSISFDLTITSLFAPLVAGRAVHFFPGGGGVRPLRDAFRTAAGYSLVKITPAHLELLARQVAAGEAAGRTRAFIIGGENLTAAHLAFWREHAPDTVLVNEYGPTETVVGCCVYQVPPGRYLAGSIPIGRPIANTQLHVLDGDLRPVPGGVAGELHVGGAGLARGYLNQPALTAAKFIPDPFSAEPGARLYRTGDLVRRLPDGNLEFLGRIDQQVKVRGYRIELGEIEVALVEHPGVREAVVTAPEDVPSGRRLIAYVVTSAASGPAPEELRAFLKSKLPDYMVPTAVVILDRLPVTLNGKVDRKALPAPERAAPPRPQGFVRPRNPVEARMARLWQDVLNVRPIGVHDDFFRLGGDSLLAAHLFIAIQKEFDTDLTPADLFRAATIEQLAGLVGGADSKPAWSSLVAIQPCGSLPPFFCVHGIGGEILSFSALARHLGEDQPFYGLRAPMAEGPRWPFTSLGDLAAHYVRQLRSLQAEGPYYLGGYSLGATLAFEMAQQLQAQGQQVGLLAILDQRLSGAGSWGDFWRPRCAIEFFKNIPRWVRHDLLKASPGVLSGRLGAKVRTFLRKMGTRVRGRGQESYKVDAESCFDARNLPEPYLDLIHALYRAQLDYEPKAYPGRVTLFRAAAQPLFRLQAPDLGWREVACGGLRVVVMPGTHNDLLGEPGVRVLGESLRACLEEARAGHGTGPPEPGLASPGDSPTAGAEPCGEGQGSEGDDPGQEPPYSVVVNDQGQYSVWPTHREMAPGWTRVGPAAPKAECLARINALWTDMRPLRLRHAMTYRPPHAPAPQTQEHAGWNNGR
jgi:amino acid adenylation domain-containing protein